MRARKLLEKLIPIYKIESNCILSRKGDITIGYEVVLPEIFTLGASEFEAIHQSWVKAFRVLPNHSIVHKQDWFVESSYKADFSKDPSSLLSHSSNLYFNERPYLDHSCYLFITKRPEGRKSDNAISILRRSPVPQQTTNDKIAEQFLDKAAQFVKILEDSGFIQLKRLTTDDLASDHNKPGLIERYCYLLSKQEIPVIRDIELRPELKVGNLHCQIFSLADVADLPASCTPQIGYEKYSTERTRFSVGFATPVAQLLTCNHIYNQYILINDAQETIQKLEKKRIRLQSLSAYSRENSISKEATDNFLNEAISQQRLPLKAHFNLITWTSDKAHSKDIKNLVSSSLAKMDVRTKQETAGAAQLFWSAIPGNASDLPLYEAFDSFGEQAACFLNQQSNSRSSLSPIGIRLGDRISGVPVYVDISDEPMQKGICTNRNKFILGPSGSGKSFFTNHMVRSYLENGTHVVIVDVGHSYAGLCELMNGYYFTYTEKDPIAFNPFFFEGEFDTEKKESIKTLLLSLWKKDDEGFTRSEYVSLSNALQAYYNHLATHPKVFPCFDTFYEYLKSSFREDLIQQGIKEKDFDIDNFLYVLQPYYKDGEFSYLLNATKNLDLLNQPFIVFELDNIKDHPILFTAVTLIIMEVFIGKMRKLKGVRKMILIEEAWKAIARQGMAEYIKYLFKTVRKHFGEAVVVTQDVDDIVSSHIIKDTIINNSDCKILMDMSKYLNRFQQIQDLLGLTEKDKTLILSMNKGINSGDKYKHVTFLLGGQLTRVYRTEVSLEEYLTYTTEEKEKILVREYAKKYGGMREGIKMLAAEIRQSKQAA